MIQAGKGEFLGTGFSLLWIGVEELGGCVDSKKSERLEALLDQLRRQDGGIGQGVAIHFQRQWLWHLSALGAVVGGFQIGIAFIDMKSADKGEPWVQAGFQAGQA